MMGGPVWAAAVLRPVSCCFARVGRAWVATLMATTGGGWVALEKGRHP
jgi:hypothetical protein